MCTSYVFHIKLENIVSNDWEDKILIIKKVLTKLFCSYMWIRSIVKKIITIFKKNIMTILVYSD